jgi:hypothetical protein
MALISPSSTCKDGAIPLQQNATSTDSRETPCLSNHSLGDSINASFTIAAQIAPYVRALSSLDQDALVETIQHMLAVAEAEAFTNYELSFTAAAATTLAEINDKVTAIIAASAVDHEPQLQHSRKDAARILGMSLHSVADYIKAGLLKARHEGVACKILHTELLRFVRSDCRKPVASKKKLLQMGVKQPRFRKTQGRVRPGLSGENQPRLG